MGAVLLREQGRPVVCAMQAVEPISWTSTASLREEGGGGSGKF